MQKLDSKVRLLFLLSAFSYFLLIAISGGIAYYFLADLTIPEKVRFLIYLAYAFVFCAGLLNLILKPTLGFNQYRYDINDEYIYLKSGYLTITEEYFPIERLQKIEISSGPIMRYFQLKSIHLLSAGSSLVIDYLNEASTTAIANDLTKKINQIIQEEDAHEPRND